MHDPEFHPFETGRARTIDGTPLQAGVNLDHVCIAAGLRELERCGYDSPHTRMIIEHSLQRWARGEEAQAERNAIKFVFEGVDYGVNFTSWRRVLAAAVASGNQKAKSS